MNRSCAFAWRVGQADLLQDGAEMVVDEAPDIKAIRFVIEAVQESIEAVAHEFQTWVLSTGKDSFKCLSCTRTWQEVATPVPGADTVDIEATLVLSGK